MVKAPAPPPMQETSERHHDCVLSKPQSETAVDPEFLCDVVSSFAAEPESMGIFG